MAEKVSVEEVLRVMIDGGKHLCEYAKSKWLGGAYGPMSGETEKMVRENYQRWVSIETEVSALGRRIKDAIKKGLL